MDDEPLTCRSFGFARRYPLVVGKLSGWTPWWGPATPTQYGVGVGVALLLLSSRRLWAHLPGALNLLVGIGLPFGLAWAVRSARFEHRTPARALLGLLSYLAVPRTGRLHGRRAPTPRPRRLHGSWIFVAALPAGRRNEAPAAVPASQPLAAAAAEEG